MKVWIVKEGAYFSDNTAVESVHLASQSAERHCRQDGFTFDSEQGFFCNEKAKLYRKLEQHTVVGSPVKSR